MYSHTQKITYKKNVSVFSTHTKKYYVIHAKKLLVFFTIQKITMYYTHTKNCHTKKLLAFFPHKKLLCSAHIQKIYYVFSHTKKYYIIHHTKNFLVFSPIQKIYYVLHAKKITYKKNVSVFSIQKITM